MFKDKDKDQDQPGKVWQESDQGQYTGQGESRIEGSDPGGSDQDRADEINEQMDESQWQGSRFSQGGSGTSNG